MRGLRRYLPWAGGIVLGLLAAQAVGFTVAGARDTGPQPAGGEAVAAQAATAAGPLAHRGGLRWLGRNRMVRAEVTVRTENGFEQRVFARGDVSAVSSSSVSVKSADGVVTTFALNGETRFRRLPRADAEREDVKAGTDVVVSGPREGQAITARRVVILPEGAGQPKPAPSPSP
jgi:hypothetical protein